MDPRHQRALKIFLAIFFLSGMSGLIYETVFTKMLGFVFGSTAYATSTVLGAFMAGLALGAWALGKRADRVKRPVRLYAILELAVAAWAICLPAILEALERMYVIVHQDMGASFAGVTTLRFVLCFVLILIPTVAMGGTLPVALRALTPNVKNAGKMLSRLYGINTFGAASGVLLAAYWIIPSLGVQGTIWLASGMNVVLAIIALAVDRRLGEVTTAVDDDNTDQENLDSVSGQRPPIPMNLLYTGAFISGFATLAYEVVWMHLLATLVGNSVYAFGIMLATFLFGLALGGSLAGRYADSTPKALGTVAATQVSLGLLVLLLMPLWDTLPQVFMWLGQVDPGFFLGEFTRFIVCSLLMVVPCTLMGMTFPLITRAVTRSSAHLGQQVGRVYAVNTMGAIAGSVACGFFLLDWLGSQTTVMALSCVSILLGVLFLWRAPVRLAVRTRRGLAFTGVLGAIVGVLVLPGWDQSVIASGANVYFDGGHRTGTVVYYHEDMHGGITSVVQNSSGVKTLLTNGKFQGNNGHEMKPQRQLAHLPMTLVQEREDMLVIGLGTGCTLGTFLQYDWKHLAVAELSPGIVEAAALHFGPINHNALTNERVSLHLTDGRNLLLLNDQEYDLIALELSSIWFAGAGNLFNREFYELAHRRLRPNGVIAQWIQVHHLTPETIMVAANTMREVFPHVSFWLVGHQGLIVGSRSPQTLDMDYVNRLDKEPKLQPFLNDLPLGTHRGLWGQLVLTEKEIENTKPLLADAGLPETSTDDNLFLEYETPKANYLAWNFEGNIATLRKLGDGSRLPLANPSGDRAVIDAAKDYALKAYEQAAIALEKVGEKEMAARARRTATETQ